MGANTPTPTWRRTAPATSTARRCSEEILEVAQFFSSAPRLMAGCTRSSTASPAEQMKAIRTKELKSIVKGSYMARQLRAGQENRKGARACGKSGAAPGGIVARQE